MNVLVLSGSPKNEDSITLQSMLFLQKLYNEDNFTIEIVGTGKYKDEYKDRIQNADLVIYTSSLFHFCVHQQTITFLNELKNKCGDILRDKPFTYFTTSIHNMDIVAHKFMESWIKSTGCRYIRSHSSLDVDVLNDNGRNEICAWYEYVRSVVNTLQSSEIPKEFLESIKTDRITLLDATYGDNEKINESIKFTEQYFKGLGVTSVEIIALREYKINPCISCSACYTDCVCCLNEKDDFMKLIYDLYKDNDIVLTFGEQQYGMIGELYKVYLDRHVQFGRHEYPVTDIMNYIKDKLDPNSLMSDWEINGYIIDSSKSLSVEDYSTFKEHCDAMNSFGGAVNAGLYELNEELASKLMQESLREFLRDIVLLAGNNVRPQMDSYGDSVHRKFRDLAWQLQKHTPRDFNFYSKMNCYKLPELNEHVVPVHSVEEGLKMRRGRLMPYKMAIALIQNGWKPNINTRRHLIGTLPPIVGDSLSENDKKEKESKKWKLFSRK